MLVRCWRRLCRCLALQPIFFVPCGMFDPAGWLWPDSLSMEDVQQAPPEETLEQAQRSAVAEADRILHRHWLQHCAALAPSARAAHPPEAA